MALDISYIIPIALRRIYQHHPEVQFKPGPFYLGDGWLGWAMNLNCIAWTLFVSVIFSLPTYLPVTVNTMNYASVITGSVVLMAMYAHTFAFFFGPLSPPPPSSLPVLSSSKTDGCTLLSRRIWYFVEYVAHSYFIMNGMTDADAPHSPPPPLCSFPFVLLCCSGRRHYRGPHAYVTDNAAHDVGEKGNGDKSSVDTKDNGTSSSTAP